MLRTIARTVTAVGMVAGFTLAALGLLFSEIELAQLGLYLGIGFGLCGMLAYAD